MKCQTLPVDLKAFMREFGLHKPPRPPEPREILPAKPWRPEAPGDEPPF